MRHLFNSAVRVEELTYSVVGGRPTMDWQQATSTDAEENRQLAFLKCRLDLNFIRPGKDAPPAENAGRAPDRIGVMFCAADAPLRAGQRVVAIPNEFGKTPVKGTFEIKVIPDVAQDFADGHHIEVQILETNQALTSDNWPELETDELTEASLP